MHRAFVTIIAITLTALAGCDMLGVESSSAVAARKEAEGKAIGGACRHAGRAIENCYTLNRKADKAAVFAGWREMNDYMRENKIDTVEPGAVAERPAEKSPDKAAEKKAAKADAADHHGKDS